MNIKIVCLIGPSGSGKSTIASELCKLLQFEMAHSTTTREPRGNKDAIEYTFISKDEFQYKIRHNEFIEHTNYSGNYYGLEKNEIERINALGRIAIRPIDFHGALMCRKLYGDACKWIYVARDANVILKEIVNRNMPAYAKINRIASLPDEQSHAQYCDFVVKNDGSVEDSVKQLCNFLEGFNND